MPLNIFNAQTIFHVSICNNVGVSSKQPILIAKFLLNAKWTKFWENSYASYTNSLSVKNFFKIFSQLYSHYSCAWLNANSRVYLQNQGQGTWFDDKNSP